MQNKLISLVFGMALTPVTALAAVPIVPQGVGVRVTTNGLNFVSKELAGRDFTIQKANVNKPNIFCYDQGVGFNNLVVAAHVNSSSFAWHATDQGLSVSVKLDTFDMSGQLYGTDSSFFSLCPNFTETINKLELTNVVLTAE